MFPGLPKDYMWTENLDHRIYALSHCHCMYPVVMQIPYNYSDFMQSVVHAGCNCNIIK